MGGEGKEQGAAPMAIAGRVPGPAAAREKSSFAVTCGLLSQYLKEKKGGLHGLAGLDMAPPSAGDGKRRHRSRLVVSFHTILSLDVVADAELNAHAMHFDLVFQGMPLESDECVAVLQEFSGHPPP